MLNQYMKSINFKGSTYQLDKNYWKGDMVNTTIDFQQKQLEYCIEVQDWNTLENRINNMLRWGGIIKL